MNEKLLVELIDLDLENNAEIYASAQATIKYLSDIVKSIEKRVLEDGEIIKGLTVVDGKSTRVITEQGFAYLATIVDPDLLYEKKPIGITKLEKIVGGEGLFNLTQLGFIKLETGNPKVIVDDK